MSNSSKDVANSSTKGAEKSSKTTKTKVKKPNRFVKFLKDLRGEVKKVVWPSKKTVFNNTGVVLTVVIVCGIFVWGIDTGFKFVFDLILSR